MPRSRSLLSAFVVALTLAAVGCSGSNPPSPTPAPVQTTVHRSDATVRTYAPHYRFLNDTAGPVRITGCRGCHRRLVAPGGHVDFTMGVGVLRISSARGDRSCWHIMNGMPALTPRPQLLRATKAGRC
ncbi:MAG: hypothetical protein QOF18_287 [Frankiaceae bacterium]|nr:hypothetical protein [Frankiaceae bacterium]